MALKRQRPPKVQDEIDIPRQYDEAQAHLFELIFMTTQDAGNYVSKLVEALIKKSKEVGGERLKGHPWSFHYISDLFSSAAYQDWRRDYLEILRVQSELAAYSFLTQPHKMERGSQTAVNAAMMIASGKLAGMDARLSRDSRGKRRSGMEFEDAQDNELQSDILGGDDEGGDGYEPVG